jgi:lysophospholipase L1-like esterase
MKRSILSLLSLLGLCLISCKKPENRGGFISQIPPVTDSPVNKKSFLALGDSYTIGQSVEPAERFPAQTVALLRSSGIIIKDPDYIATTGWTTDDLSLAISRTNPPSNYSVVTLLIGVNDQFQRHDTSGYRSRFTGLLNTAITLASSNNAHVFVLSIPDYSVTPVGMYYDTASIRQQINWFNEINKEVTIEQHCNYLDITPSTRDALYDPSLVTYDGLHPSGLEYQKWARKLLPMMYEALK